MAARSLWLPGAALLWAALPLGCERGRPDPVVISFHDQVVRRSEFERQLTSLEREGPLEGSVRRALFDSFVEERLLVLEARRRGLLALPAGGEEEREAVQQLLLDAAPAPAVAEQEIVDYYGEHSAELAVPETVKLSQILVRTENEARDVRRRLQKDPKSFEVLARTVSRGPEASSGGLMGSFAPGQLPAELESAAFALPVGAHSDPVHTPFGYHVLRLDARAGARARALEDCREQIRSLLRRQKSERAVRSFTAELLARAKVNHEAVEAADRPS